MKGGKPVGSLPCQSLAKQAPAADCLQPTLRSGFQQRLRRSVRQRVIKVEKMATLSTRIFPEEVPMPPGRPPISTTTRLYGHFAHQIEHRPQPLAVAAYALLDQRGV